MGIKIEKVIPLYEHIYQKYNKIFAYLEMKYISTKHLDSALKLCHRELAQEYEDKIELWKTYGGS